MKAIITYEDTHGYNFDGIVAVNYIDGLLLLVHEDGSVSSYDRNIRIVIC